MRKRDSWWDEAILTVIIAMGGGIVTEKLRDSPVLGIILGAVIGLIASAWLRHRYVKPWSEAVDFADEIAKQIDGANEEIRSLQRSSGRLEQDLAHERTENANRNDLIAAYKEQTAAYKEQADAVRDERDGPRIIAAKERLRVAEEQLKRAYAMGRSRLGDSTIAAISQMHPHTRRQLIEGTEPSASDSVAPPPSIDGA